MSHVGTNDLPTDMTPEEISEKLSELLFLNIRKQKIFVSDIVPRDDYLKSVEAVNKLLKDTCTK